MPHYHCKAMQILSFFISLYKKSKTVISTIRELRDIE